MRYVGAIVLLLGGCASLPDPPNIIFSLGSTIDVIESAGEPPPPPPPPPGAYK